MELAVQIFFIYFREFESMLKGLYSFLFHVYCFSYVLGQVNMFQLIRKFISTNTVVEVLLYK